MRLMAGLLAAGLALAGCQKADAPAARKPGLWEQRVSGGAFSQVSRVCLDAAADARMGWIGEPAGAACQKPPLKKQGQGWRFETVCDLGPGGKTVGSGTVSGDLSSRYVVQAESTTTGAMAPQLNGTRRFTVEAAWQGPCPADMKPGDLALPGGVKINLLDLAG